MDGITHAKRIWGRVRAPGVSAEVTGSILYECGRRSETRHVAVGGWISESGNKMLVEVGITTYEKKNNVITLLLITILNVVTSLLQPLLYTQPASPSATFNLKNNYNHATLHTSNINGCCTVQCLRTSQCRSAHNEQIVEKSNYLLQFHNQQPSLNKSQPSVLNT